MDGKVRDALLAVNRSFYRHHGETFDAKRRHPWGGWRTVLDSLRAQAGPLRVLDAGCGNGRFGTYLVSNYPGDIDYWGTDTCRGLLRLAEQRLRGDDSAEGTLRSHFQLTDLVETPDLRKALGSPPPFDLIVLFGVLHHIPGFVERRRLLRRLAGLLAGNGLLAASFWDFSVDPRWRRRVVPWPQGAPEIDPQGLEPGDFLLTWGGCREHPRYCHLASAAEIDLLSRALPIGVTRSFQADGPSGAENTYVLWAAGNPVRLASGDPKG